MRIKKTDCYLSTQLEHDFRIMHRIQLKDNEFPEVSVNGVKKQFTRDCILFREGDTWVVRIKGGVSPYSEVTISYLCADTLEDRIKLVKEAFGLKDEDLLDLLED